MQLRNDSRTTVIGRTGSGKTQFGAWLLSTSNFDTRPWIVLDSKRDSLFARMARERLATIHHMGWKPHKMERGIHIVQPLPDDRQNIEELLKHLWRMRKCGLWIDEAYAVPQTAPLIALLTSGRSRQVQMITLVQRPVDVSRFVLSEADYYCVFHLNDSKDIKRVAEFVPTRANNAPFDFSSIWYSIRDGEPKKMLRCPSAERILDAIAAKAPRPYFW